MTIKIVTDSTCDIPPALAEQYGITVIPCYINLGGKSYLDGVELSREEFYRLLPTASPHPTTAAPGQGAFLAAYRRLLDEGAEAIISIHISESLSGVVNAARMAAAEHSSLPVHVVDSGQLSFGLGLQALEAAKAAAAGASLDELLTLLDSLAARTFAFASLSTLEYLRRGGRISNLGTQIASLLDIKPIMKMNRGKAGMEVARTRRRALERVISLTASLGRLEAIGFTHANAADEVAALRERLAPYTAGLPEPVINDATPAIGAHVGPGTVCAVCLAAEAPSGQGPNTVERIRQTIKTLAG